MNLILAILGEIMGLCIQHFPQMSEHKSLINILLNSLKITQQLELILMTVLHERELLMNSIKLVFQLIRKLELFCGNVGVVNRVTERCFDVEDLMVKKDVP